MGVFQFETEVLDYGNLKQNDAGTATFTFKNVGSAPIVISDVKTSCGCTLANAPEEAVLPGEEAKIEVNYNTKKVGKFSKSITVISNASESKKVLKIKGEVLKNPSR